MNIKLYAGLVGLCMVGSLQAFIATNATIWPMRFSVHYIGVGSPLVFELQPGETKDNTQDGATIKTGYKVEVKQTPTSDWQPAYDQPTTAGGWRHAIAYFEYKYPEKAITGENTDGKIKVFDRLL